MAGSSDNRIALDTDNMRDIGAGYTVSCSNAIQIEVRFNVGPDVGSDPENQFKRVGWAPTRPVPFWTFCAGLMVIDW